MKYVLDDLLRIRLLREERAERELLMRRQELNNAIRFLREREEDLARYRLWRPLEEEKLFKEVQNKLVKREDVENLRIKIGLLREREIAKEGEVQEAKRKLQEAENLFNKAKNSYREALQGRQKIEEHRKVWLLEAKKQEEEKSDKELEEFSSTIKVEF
ncbi:MAG: YscO family type III secretion system apparatus protein [Thermodesulforhabdaceae bacterium]